MITWGSSSPFERQFQLRPIGRINLVWRLGQQQAVWAWRLREEVATTFFFLLYCWVNSRHCVASIFTFTWEKREEEKKRRRKEATTESIEEGGGGKQKEKKNIAHRALYLYSRDPCFTSSLFSWAADHFFIRHILTVTLRSRSFSLPSFSLRHSSVARSGSFKLNSFIGRALWWLPYLLIFFNVTTVPFL